MKKMIYFLMLAAAMSLAFTSCKGKEDADDSDEEDMDAITYVIAADSLA